MDNEDVGHGGTQPRDDDEEEKAPAPNVDDMPLTYSGISTQVRTCF